ncbi:MULTISPECIES: hypothetical protein [unclassified Nonomuraea]|uniref:hypothetical protein n=1 Tax=unclassified Nonomuraea TaxID=2593643 RepID=UPI0034041905
MREIEQVERMRAQIPLPDPGELAARIGWRPGERARPRRGRVRLLVLAPATAILAAVLLAVLSALPPGVVTSYANAAIAVTREGGAWVARIKDPLAESAKYAEAFAAVGLDVELQLVPASPARVGDLVLARGVRADGQFQGGLEPEGCRIGQAGCHLTFRVPAGFTGPVRAQLGRPAVRDELYRAAAGATERGERLEGVTVKDRRVGEVRAELRGRGLEAVYERVRDDPGNTEINFIDGMRGEFHLTYEPAGAADVGDDWLVWEALSYREGVVKLQVTPRPLRPVGARG